MGRRQKHPYVVRTPVQPPGELPLPAGPPPSTISPRRYARMLATLARRQPDLVVVLENLHDPFNLSAVLRTCDAVGVGTVHLVYNQEQRPHISPGVAGSAQRWLTLHRHTSIEEVYAALRRKGARIYATGVAQGSLLPHEADLTRPSAFVLGNENRGLSQTALVLADAVLCIPMRGMVQSVSVTAAAAMLLYEAQRQRTAAGLYDAPRLPEADWRAILECWLAREHRQRQGD